MTNVRKIFLHATAAVTLALGAAGAAHAQQIPSGYVPPETTYEPPTVPPETGPGTVVTNDIDNTNTNNNSNNNNNSNYNNNNNNNTNNNSNTNNNTNNNNNSNSNNNTANGGAGGNGGSANVGDIVNSFSSRVYSYAGGPALGAAVAGCLAVTGTSGHVGIAGVNVGLGGTRANFNEQCAQHTLQVALLQFMTLNRGDAAIQAFVIETLREINPVLFGPAIEVVIRGEVACEGQARSPFALLAAARGDISGQACRAFGTAAAAPAAVVVPRTDVTVNVDLNTGARTAPRATAPRASAPRAAAPRVRSTGRTTVRPNADGSCPTGTTAVTTCVVQPRR